MDETQGSNGMMAMSKVTFWFKNQVAFTFHSSLDPSEGKQRIIDSLPLDELNQFLAKQGQVTLRSFDKRDVPHLRPSQGPDDYKHDISGLKSPVGKYLFPSPVGAGSTVITFFHIEASNMVASVGKDIEAETDHTVRIVNLTNTTGFIPTPSGEKVRAPAAMPNWFSGGTPDTTHGCPTSPPMPVPADSFCTSSPGYWPISLPELSPTMQEKNGDGVTVFVLDTLPTPERITSASQAANPPGSEPKNLLLQKMAADMKSSAPFDAVPPAINVNWQSLSENLDTLNAPATGRDLYQKLIGFEMPDHGLFIAGIIRDLAPKAKIECIRVLNDLGVGTVSVLTQTLEAIQGRMMMEDLQKTPVVINLSLVITPPDEVIIIKQFDPKTIDGLREGLHQVIQSLIKSGAVFIAAAGNDSNTPDMPERIGPRYPAAFPEVISVGAVIGDQNETAASYSDRATSPEQPNGIATYGGNIAKPVTPASSISPLPPVAPTPIDCMTGAIDIDAVIGVYSSPTYSKLADQDCQLSYPAPNPNAWAYWSGTSFSTPIISALVARLLQGLNVSNVPSSQQIIATVNSSVVTSQSLPRNVELGNVSVLRAVQCKPPRYEGEDEGTEEVEINITEVNIIEVDG